MAEETPAPAEVPATQTDTQAGTATTNNYTSGGGTGLSTTRSIPNASRKVVGLMGTAVIFSLAGTAISNAQTPTATPSVQSSGLDAYAKIIIGGTIGAALLSGLAEAGNALQQFAVGLAGLAALSAILIKGGPVFAELQKLFSSKPTGRTGMTAATPSTTPTGGS